MIVRDDVVGQLKKDYILKMKDSDEDPANLLEDRAAMNKAEAMALLRTFINAEDMIQPRKRSSRDSVNEEKRSSRDSIADEKIPAKQRT